MLATVTTFAGLVVVGPTLARGMARLADHGRRGGGWRMAARNIARNSRRAAATALALTIGLTVVAAVAVTAASLKDSVSDAVSGGNRSDLILEPAGAGHRDQPVGGGPAARPRRRRATSSSCASRRRQVNGHELPGRPALDTAGLDQRDRPRHRDGEPRRPRARHACWSAPTQADDLGVGTGDTVDGDLPRDRRRRPCGSRARSARAA